MSCALAQSRALRHSPYTLASPRSNIPLWHTYWPANVRPRVVVSSVRTPEPRFRPLEAPEPLVRRPSRLRLSCVSLSGSLRLERLETLSRLKLRHQVLRVRLVRPLP